MRIRIREQERNEPLPERELWKREREILDMQDEAARVITGGRAFRGNGSHAYDDHGHPEYATAECRSPDDVSMQHPELS